MHEDDILIPVSPSCSFEKPFICGYDVVGGRTGFYWSQRKISDKGPSTKPKRDNTYGEKGTYMYMYDNI